MEKPYLKGVTLLLFHMSLDYVWRVDQGLHTLGMKWIGPNLNVYTLVANAGIKGTIELIVYKIDISLTWMKKII